MDLRNQLLADRFLCESELARGGMGRVYRATDVRLHTPVVVKVPFAGPQNKRVTKRFVREIEGLKHLRHPHIVRILYSGVHNGVPYYVSPFLKGGSLSARIKEHGALDLRSTRAWAAPIAAALDRLHEDGVVHRDVKPSNILFDAHGAPYLADFGVLHLADESGKRTTQYGIPVGTPAFMAPEQVGSGKRLTGKADQYALAVSICIALTGETPFEGTTSEAVMREKLDGAPKRLSELPLEPRLRRVLRRAFLPEPGDRFHSCGDLVQALTPPAHETVGRSFKWPLVAAALFAAAMGAWLWTRSSDETAPVPAEGGARRAADSEEAASADPNGIVDEGSVEPEIEPARHTLFGAARRGDLVALQALLEGGADPTVPDARGLTPLHHAAWRGHVAAVKRLLDGGAPVDADRGRLVYGNSQLEEVTPFYLAVLYRHPVAARVLLDAGAATASRVKQRDLRDADKSPVELDAWGILLLGDDTPAVGQVVSALVAGGLDVDGGLPANVPLKDGSAPPLWVAVRAGAVHLVQGLLAAGASTAHRDRVDDTIAHVAAGNRTLAKQSPTRFLDVLRALAPHADLNAGMPGDVYFARIGEFPLGRALLIPGCEPAVGVLLELGADPNLALPMLAANDRIDLLRSMAERGADLKTPRALLLAARNDKPKSIAFLVANGADPNGPKTDGGPMQPPLHAAADQGAIAAARQLIKLGADPHALDPWGRDALWHAATGRQVGMCRFLIDTAVTRRVAEARAGLSDAAKKDFPSYRKRVQKQTQEILALLDNLTLVRKGGVWHRTVQVVPDTPKLHRLAATGEAQALQAHLASSQVPVDALNSSGNTALHVAAALGRLEAVKILIGAGAQVDALGSGGASEEDHRTEVTPLMHALVGGHAETTSTLLQLGASAKHRDSMGVSVLDLAAEFGRVFALRPLRRAGANFNRIPANKRLPPLWIAARHGQDDMVRAMMKAGASVKGKTPDGQTLVSTLLRAGPGHHETLAEILEAKATLPTRSSFDSIPHDPVEIATGNTDGPALKVLAKHGANLYYALHSESQVGTSERVRALVEAGADPVDSSAMYWAVGRGNLETVKVLMELGVSINARRPGQDTPLMAAARYDQPRHVLQHYIDQGADPSLRTDAGKSVLHEAANFGSSEAVRFFVDFGFSILEKTGSGSTPLDLARSHSRRFEDVPGEEEWLAGARDCVRLIQRLVDEKSGPPKQALQLEAARALSEFDQKYNSNDWSDRGASTNRWAIRKLADIQHKAVVDRLATFLGDRRPRSAAIRGLSRQRGLSNYAGSKIDSAWTRADLAATLAAFASLSYLTSEERLRPLLRHEQRAVRRQVITTIGETGDLRLLDDLVDTWDRIESGKQDEDSAFGKNLVRALEHLTGQKFERASEARAWALANKATVAKGLERISTRIEAQSAAPRPAPGAVAPKTQEPADEAAPPPPPASDDAAEAALKTFRSAFRARGLSGDRKQAQRDFAMSQLAEVHHRDVADELARIAHRHAKLREVAVVYLGQMRAVSAWAGYRVTAVLRMRKSDPKLQVLCLQNLALLDFLLPEAELRRWTRHKDTAVSRQAIKTVRDTRDVRFFEELASRLQELEASSNADRSLVTLLVETLGRIAGGAMETSARAREWMGMPAYDKSKETFAERLKSQVKDKPPSNK